MKGFGPLFSASGVALLVSLSGCGGSGSGSGRPMFVETCSLGCSSGQGGIQVTCTTDQSALNQEIAVYFSEDVDESSINSATLKFVDVTSGAVPSGTRFRDSGNHKKVVFRPSVTFDDQGNPSFGFDPDRTYRVDIPGSSQGDDPPFIRSEAGVENQSRLRCDIHTTNTVIDQVPGAPQLTSVLVDQAIVSTPDPNDTIQGIEAAGATDVWRNSQVKFIFNDLMNPVTLASPLTGQASFVTIEVDLDGDLATTGDRTTLAGTYVVELDQVMLQTTMTFTPTSGMPSSGNTPPMRQVVINVPNNLQDLANHPLANPAVGLNAIHFTPEDVLLPPVVLPDADGENFTDQANYDAAHSNADWGSGRLTQGVGGGSGRLGELHVISGQTLTLNTDDTTFPLDPLGAHDVLTNTHVFDYNTADPSTYPTVHVTNGVFEFSKITIESAARLVFTGTQPARLFSRGSVNIIGTIDVRGQPPTAHDSSLIDGGAGGAGGPFAGDGGQGATRFDTTSPDLLLAGGVHITTIPVREDGVRGQGVGRTAMLAAGFPGVHYPPATPTDGTLSPGTLGNTVFSHEDSDCIDAQVASPGGGGAYATDGLPAVPNSFPLTNLLGLSNLASPVAGGGSASELGLEPPGAPPVIRKLAFEQGNLRGGSGGGGGGAHLYGTTTTGFFVSQPSECIDNMDSDNMVDFFRDHSACGGGGGGGVLQFVSGGAMSISGLIDAEGGRGGSAIVMAGTTEDVLRPTRSVPGGGGSGGAVRLQALNLQLTAATPPRIHVGGGMGGTNNLSAAGGAGGAGLVRLEDRTGTLSQATEALKIAPTDPLVVGMDAINILSVGGWAPPRLRPETLTAGMSCWMKPTGNFFQISFIPDDLSQTDPDLKYGWNCDISYDNGSGLQTFPYRGAVAGSPIFPNDFQTEYTDNIAAPDGTSGAYVAVRFQGARAITGLPDPCNVDLMSDIQAGSLTPWVNHPADLNAFSPRPNMIRFCVVFDSALSVGTNPQRFIKGIKNLKIRTQPD